MTTRLVHVGLLASLGAPAAAAPAHQDEILALATIVAMAQTASDRCADILVSNDMLDKAPGFFHLQPDDRQAYAFTARLEMQRLAAAVAAAPSLKAWCDEAYRHYGPNDDFVRDLLKR